MQGKNDDFQDAEMTAVEGMMGDVMTSQGSIGANDWHWVKVPFSIGAGVRFATATVSSSGGETGTGVSLCTFLACDAGDTQDPKPMCPDMTPALTVKTLGLGCCGPSSKVGFSCGKESATLYVLVIGEAKIPEGTCAAYSLDINWTEN